MNKYTKEECEVYAATPHLGPKGFKVHCRGYVTDTVKKVTSAVESITKTVVKKTEGVAEKTVKKVKDKVKKAEKDLKGFFK